MYILTGGSVVLGRITWKFKLRVSFCNMKMKNPPQTFNYIWSQLFLHVQGRSGCFVWKIIFFLLASSRVLVIWRGCCLSEGSCHGAFWQKQRPERLEILFCNILCLFKEDKLTLRGYKPNQLTKHKNKNQHIMKTFSCLSKHICPVEGGCPVSIINKKPNTRPPHCLLIGLMVDGVAWCSVSVPHFSCSHHPHSCLLTIVWLFTYNKQASQFLLISPNSARKFL